MKHIIPILVILLLLSSGFVGVSYSIDDIEQSTITTFYDGNILYVGGNGTGNYTKIQDAINDSEDGDTVFVYDDSSPYYENLNVNKSITLIGEDKDTTVIDGRYSDYIIILVTSSDVTVREFTVQNCYEEGLAQAFYLYGNPYLENIYISDCIIKNNDKGVFFINITNLSITNCHIHHNLGATTWGRDSSNITVSNCLAHDKGRVWRGGWITPGSFEFDFEKFGCSDIKIFNCTIYDVIGYGIGLIRCNNVQVYQNNVSKGTWYGISCTAVSNIVLHHNHIYENEFHGIRIDIGLPGVIIHNNNISDNGNGNQDDYGGIWLQRCDSNVTIMNNIFRSNQKAGVYSLSSQGVFIIDNDFIGHSNGISFYPNTHNANIYGNNIRGNKYGLSIFGDHANISGNFISKNEYGVELFGDHNIVSYNEISNNDYGVKLHGIDSNNTMVCNNFLENMRDAMFSYLFVYDFPDQLPTINNRVDENYWNRPRLLPKPIVGQLKLFSNLFDDFRLPWICFDWRPARSPYSIDREYNIPFEKELSCHEICGELIKSGVKEKSSICSNSSPLLVKKVKPT